MTTPSNAPAPKSCATGRCSECGIPVSPHAPKTAPLTKNPALLGAQREGLIAQRDEYKRQIGRLEAQAQVAAARKSSPSVPRVSVAARERAKRGSL